VAARHRSRNGRVCDIGVNHCQGAQNPFLLPLESIPCYEPVLFVERDSLVRSDT
jgi:hypothetical protein